MELVFAYLAGLLTLINPCVLPVLPIVLAGSLQTDRRAPVALAAGMGAAFVGLGMVVAALGPAFGIYPEDVTRFAALVMAGFGAIMVLPALGRRFSTATAGVTADDGLGLHCGRDGAFPWGQPHARGRRAAHTASVVLLVELVSFRP